VAKDISSQKTTNQLAKLAIRFLPTVENVLIQFVQFAKEVTTNKHQALNSTVLHAQPKNSVELVMIMVTVCFARVIWLLTNKELVLLLLTILIFPNKSQNKQLFMLP
jgi:hypothetical protein